MGTRYRVYLSSTYQDLQEYRQAVYTALRKLSSVEQVVAMEDYVAADQRPLSKVLQDVEDCDIYVGIFAWRYGFVPPPAENPEGKSITELELRRAKSLGKPCLIFVLKPGVPWNPEFLDSHTGEHQGGGRVQALRKELLEDYLASPFTDAAQLAGLVSAAVSNHIALQHPDETNRPAPPTPPPHIREVRDALYLCHSPLDGSLVEALAPALGAGLEQRVLVSGKALFAVDPDDFDALDRHVTRCHAAVVVVSPASLAQLEARHESVGAVIDVMRARTGAVAAVLVDVARDLPPRWRFDEVFVVPAPVAGGGIPPATLARAKAWVADRMPPSGIRTIGVPIAVLAMLKTDLDSLETTPSFVADRLGKPVAERYERLKQELRDSAVAWTERYRATRAEWRPFSPKGRSLIEILDELVDGLNERGLPKLRHRRLKLQWYPFDPLLQADHPLRRTYREVARTGLVMIVDEISFFHPDLREAFQNSPFFNNDQVAIVTISPLDPGCVPLEQLLESETRRKLAGAFDRYAVDCDPQCEFAVGDERRLKRWLHASLPETVTRLQEPQPDREAMRAFYDHELGGERARPKGDYLWASGGRP